ncbi:MULTISPECIES: hypothetical protein [unclassified Nostoc]|nr:hypothetical protein [Nostoc sp. 'Peltigera membranacea cyanobiont' 232]OYE00106.1 hypothetical protein CDG79_37025 [Nostoc sp. 'Peltigera membranacea cyanobiont' 232]
MAYPPFPVAIADAMSTTGYTYATKTPQASHQNHPSPWIHLGAFCPEFYFLTDRQRKGHKALNLFMGIINF